MGFHADAKTLREWERRGLLPPDAMPAVRTRTPVAMARHSVTLGVVLPVETASESNCRSWRARSRRTRAVREAWAATIRVAPEMIGLAPPYRIHLTRLGGRRLDADNLYGAMKAAKDCVAAWLLGGKSGERDDDPQLTWAFDQRPGGERGVLVLIGMGGGE